MQECHENEYACENDQDKKLLSRFLFHDYVFLLQKMPFNLFFVGDFVQIQTPVYDECCGRKYHVFIVGYVDRHFNKKNPVANYAHNVELYRF
jgi:hypothetical protein